jgi:acetoin utilization deacetylase AcuC-like enzyme
VYGRRPDACRALERGSPACAAEVLRKRPERLGPSGKRRPATTAPVKEPAMERHPYDSVVDVYYRPEMAMPPDFRGGYSRTPAKPMRYVKHLQGSELAAHIQLRSDFEPLPREEFLRAHTREYVDAFFRGDEPLCSSNGMPWSPRLAETVRYTNASLCAAIEGALERPARIALSPTGGFHHAQPERGNGFCTFSGQVIGALRVYEARGAVGAWFDLDGHFGNSIEDSRDFAPLLDRAIPRGLNVNPSGRDASSYLRSLLAGLQRVGAEVRAGRVHYVAFAHGADSHVDDDLGAGVLDTEAWLECSRLVYSSLADWSRALGRPVPLVLALFGGYREDDPSAVDRLHAADLAVALTTLAGVALA